MCVSSMVMNHYHNKWHRPPYYPPEPRVPGVPFVSPITPAEIAEFRSLLRKAREYDAKHHEPDCELDEKQQKILELANALGVDVSFVKPRGRRAVRKTPAAVDPHASSTGKPSTRA